jgi:hypothetical protein
VTGKPNSDDGFLWVALNLDRLQDSDGRFYDQEAGVFRPDGLPEFGSMLDAWRRGTKRSRLRLFAAVCPGERSHALVEVYPPDIVFTRYYVQGSTRAVLPLDRLTDARLGRLRVEARGKTQTVSAAALLSELMRNLPPPQQVPSSSYRYGRGSLSLRCCVSVSLDPAWIAAMVTEGRRRVVVPDDSLARVMHAELEAELDAEQGIPDDDTPR